MSGTFRFLTAWLAFLLASMGGPAWSQPWPARPVKLIVNSPPGGASDVMARVVAAPLGEVLGQQVVVENKPGGGGLIATEFVARAAPDGYTLLLATPVNTLFPYTRKRLNHDPIRSFEPVTLLGQASLVLVAHPSLGARSLQEVLQLAKARPGTLSYASPGAGSPQNLSMEVILNHHSAEMVHVPYKGGGQAVVDLVSGQVTLGMLGMAPVLPHIRSGKLLALATTGKSRSLVLPDVATVAESGVPDFETGQWQGILAPAGTPAPIVNRLHAELVRIMRQPDVRKKLEEAGIDDTRTSASPAEYRAMLIAEIKKWEPAVRRAGIQPE
jgi:tripartite-type tricarboxylate transporter receptor subunit TctC